MIKKILKVVWHIVKIIITVLILAIVGIILLQRITNNQTAIAGIRIFTVVTESMVPVYNVGDVLLVIDKEKSEIQVGEDIAYLGKEGSFVDKVVTHRVVKIDDNEGTLVFHTKGVANEEEDPVIDQSQIYGTVRHKVKIMSWLNEILNNMYGMYFLVAIPLAVIFLSEIKAFREDKKIVEKDYNHDVENESIKNDNSLENEVKSDKIEEREYKKAQKRKEKREKRREKYKNK